MYCYGWLADYTHAHPNTAITLKYMVYKDICVRKGISGYMEPQLHVSFFAKTFYVIKSGIQMANAKKVTSSQLLLLLLRHCWKPGEKYKRGRKKLSKFIIMVSHVKMNDIYYILFYCLAVLLCITGKMQGKFFIARYITWYKKIFSCLNL